MILSVKLRLFLGVSLMLLPLLATLTVARFSLFELLETLDMVNEEVVSEVEPVFSIHWELQRVAHQMHNLLEGSTAYPEQTCQQLNSKMKDLFLLGEQIPFNSPAEVAFLEQADSYWSQVFQVCIEGTSRTLPDLELQAELEELAEKATWMLFMVRKTAYSEVDQALSSGYAISHTAASTIQVILLCGIFLTMVCGFLLARSVLTPVRLLQNGIKRFGDGKLDHRISLARQDEFGSLAESFNLMADQLSQTQERLKALSTIDYLTELNNVREFYRLIQDELGKANRYQRDCSLMLVDIDHFKQINDQHGHQVGDQVLQSLAMQMRELVRTSDHLARIGGDEFTIILPETETAECFEIADRLRNLIADSRLPEQPDLQVTVSIGLATYPDHARTVGDLFSTADRALYKAKSSGRNQVCCSEAD